MLRLAATALCMYCQRARVVPLPYSRLWSAHSSDQVENKLTVDSLYQLSVDVQKVRKLKGWVLCQSPAYVSETAGLLQDMGADGAAIARILEQHPEAVLCSPEETQAQIDLWRMVCPQKKELVNIIEKFPASFFTVSHRDNQRANIQYFQSLGLNKRTVSKLMASAPQSFSHPVEQNQEMIHTLSKAYLSLGGDKGNAKTWLQKLLSQNPFVLAKPPEAVRANLMFLRDVGFTSIELLRLMSKLRGFITDLDPGAMRDTLAYSQRALRCSEAELREITLKCPALLYYSVPMLADRLEGLLKAGVGVDQIKDTPTVLELTTQIVLYRIQKLESYGYDVKAGSLEALNGTKKDFEMSNGRLHLRRQRPLFNPVAPLKTTEE